MRDWTDPIPALKQQVADELLRVADGFSQTWAAWRLHLPRSRGSTMRRGNLDGISLERLIVCLSRLGYRVDITISREPRTPPPR